MSDVFVIIPAIICVVIISYVISHVISSASVKGRIGENRVSHKLRALPRQYRVINNLIIPGYRSTTQIDHVVVSPYGIFVIETKNYSGWIFGKEDSEQWKQTFRTTEGHFFRNPIKQNWGHIYALAAYLNLDRGLFWPIVVFSNKPRLNVESTTPVIYMSQLRRHILNYYNQVIIPSEDVNRIYNRLINTNLVGTDVGKRHTQSVKENIREQEKALKEGKCPRCGGELRLRNGKFGAFYGCSNYPKCKYTHNVKMK